MKILCKKTHDRSIGSDIYTFIEGKWYELTTRPQFYEPDYLGYYIIKHPDYLNEGGFVVSKLFLQTRFVTPAEWRDKQIDSILND
jgi:hypothetical protein